MIVKGKKQKHIIMKAMLFASAVVVICIMQSCGSPTFTIEVSDNPNDYGEIVGGGVYDFGQSCTVHASANAGYFFSGWTENGIVASTNADYTFIVTEDRSLVANFGCVNGSYNGHDYVDLGLPSGTLWATCNVGAETPEDFGDYFAWGEITTKTTYAWSTYKYSYGDDDVYFLDPVFFTKYCTESNYGYNGFTDNLTTLQPDDDAATENWGIGWCMPTAGQWRELIDKNNISYDTTTRNGVFGEIIIARNGNSLFLPAAGYRRENSSPFDTGSRGYYWSNSLVDLRPTWAYYFNFDYVIPRDGFRCFGLAVRPITSSKL